MASTGIYEIWPLTLGWERLPKSFSIHGDTSGETLVEPVGALLLRTDSGWILIDTGCNPALIRDQPLYERLHARNHGIVPILPEGGGDPLLDALAARGLGVSDISEVVLSHLHNDHAGGLRHFAGRVPVTVQRTELEYGLAAHPFPEQHGMFRIDFDDPEHDWVLIEGDVELRPGLRTVLTPGHTPGHQSFVVALDDEAGGDGFVFTFDAADLTENIEHELAVGGFVHCEAQDTIAPIRRLKAIAAELGHRIVPGHDPVVWPELTAELEARWGKLSPA
jgi:glyoxylase-like metal-dependent hydrolase (beta-lactamase superfamily II)